jgi:hypothetical protein
VRTKGVFPWWDEAGFHMSPKSLPMICFLSKGTRFDMNPTAASKLLIVVHHCTTQVVLVHEIRCLNVALDFSGLAHGKMHSALGILCGRSECILEGEGDGGRDGDGGEDKEPQ